MGGKHQPSALLEQCVGQIAAHIHGASSLSGLPAELQQRILTRILLNRLPLDQHVVSLFLSAWGTRDNIVDNMLQVKWWYGEPLESFTEGLALRGWTVMQICDVSRRVSSSPFSSPSCSIAHGTGRGFD
eukprot:TRINITY_DN40900_c0_g1_i2.p1 TRINITY_DN40900_c0_g1~~TRINITY_DN40900_c0_g1_i2.p1  ORF type:complete len:129 (-),score=30.74 TRINITY_DN40900_c0_g1_i2:328-714(-)